MKGVKHMKKKSILSVLLILSILAGAMTLGVTPAAAVSKPTLYAPVNIKGGQRLTWSNVGASRYYLYFGVYDYNTCKQEWRVYREVRDTSFEITYNSLHSSGWKKYLNYQPTPQLTSGQVYCYQVHAGKINSAGRPVDRNYSSVRTMTYLKAPYLNYSIDGNQICIGGYSEGTPGYISWIYDATYSDKCIYEARAVLQTKNNGTAYSAWASFKLPY